MATSTKSELSKLAAVRAKVASSNAQSGDHIRHSSRAISVRYAASPARPRSVWKYHWYQ